MNIVLTWPEVVIAAEVGIKRHIYALSGNRTHRWGNNGADAWTMDVEGACGEFAVAKALNKFWSGGVVGGDDVHCYQVRHSKRDDARLILHPDDADEKEFILVTGRIPMFRLIGWILARDGKLPEYWDDPTGVRPAFFVPQSKLHDITTLAI